MAWTKRRAPTKEEKMTIRKQQEEIQFKAAEKAIAKLFNVEHRFEDLRQLASMAQANIRKQIERGNPIASMFLIQTVYGRIEQAPLLTSLEGARFRSMEEVNQAGEQILDLVASGRLPLAQAKEFITILKNFTSLKLAEEIKRLEQLLETIDANQSGPKEVTQTLPQDMLPSWGGFGGDAKPDPDEEAIRQTLLS